MKTDARLHEADLIAWLARTLPARDESVLVGIGDDAAVVEASGGGRLILTNDCLIDGIHFRLGETSPRLIGRKAVMRAVSDIAAMAGRPRWILAALCLPRGVDGQTVKALCLGMRAACRTLGVAWVGGDLSRTSGPLAAVVTVIGEVLAPGAVRRAGAAPGDAVCVTGRLGGSILGRQFRFRPRLAEAQRLARRFRPHAMTDLSDGLSTDARHLADAGGVRLVLHERAIPVSAAARRLGRLDGRPALAHALNDGEDYELLFTLAPRDAARAAAEGLCGTAVTVIGCVEEGRGVVIASPDGRRRELAPEGYEHVF